MMALLTILPLFKIFKMKKIICTIFIVTYLSITSFGQVVPQGYLIGPQTIGGQLWALVNLSTSVFADGTTIPYYTSASAFAGLVTPASCSVNFNPANDAVYGRFYNWYAVIDTRNVCPVGWHVPNNTDFSTLNTTIGGNGNGNKLKATAYTYWSSGGGTDSYNFKAIGTGYMGSSSYSHFGQSTYFWTINEVSAGSGNAYTWSLLDGPTTLTQSSQGKIGGFSVRCIHD
jgi:uncharacterized protein (TIGR02145 family)